MDHSFNNQELLLADIKALDSGVRSLRMSKCSSTEWRAIGEALSSLQLLSQLTLADCNSSNELCRQLSQSTSLTDITIGTEDAIQVRCGITEKGVSRLSSIPTLLSLHLGMYHTYHRRRDPLDRHHLSSSLPKCFQPQQAFHAATTTQASRGEGL